MSNSIRVSVTFSFKGKTHHPTIILDLDQYFSSGTNLENLYAQLARQNNIDHYSYEYEMLQSEPLQFDQPEGLAKKYMTENGFDIDGLQQAWQTQKQIEKLTKIARRHMDIEQLKDIDGLEQTLLEVYLADR